MEPETLIYEVDGSIAIVTLNRPDLLNAWSRQMELEFRQVVYAAAGDDRVGAIVLTGAGKAFSAGGDKELLLKLARDGFTPETAPPQFDVDPEQPIELQGRFSFLWGLAKPVICAINGAAAGVGFALAMYCDFRFAVPDAKLIAPFARLGLPAEQGLAWVLPQLVGVSAATEILLTGRPVGAVEAKELGLVHRLFEPDSLIAETLAFATELAAGTSQDSIQMIKRQIYEGLGRGFGDALRLSENLTAEAVRRPDFREAVDAIHAKRRPRFKGKD